MVDYEMIKGVTLPHGLHNWLHLIAYPLRSAYWHHLQLAITFLTDM
jgi:hypothetical protein